MERSGGGQLRTGNVGFTVALMTPLLYAPSSSACGLHSLCRLIVWNGCQISITSVFQTAGGRKRNGGCSFPLKETSRKWHITLLFISHCLELNHIGNDTFCLVPFPIRTQQKWRFCDNRRWGHGYRESTRSLLPSGGGTFNMRNSQPIRRCFKDAEDTYLP